MTHVKNGFKPRARRLKVGIVANEFFDEAIGRMGGFGWSVAQVARLFNSRPELGIDPIFLTGELRARKGKDEVLTHGTRLILRPSSKTEYLRRVWSERIDLLFSLDYRSNYQFVYWSLPRTPLIVWVHDPRTKEDTEKIGTLQIPGANGSPAQGISAVDCTSLRRVVTMSQWTGRRVFFAAPALFLREKTEGTYGIKTPDLGFLPNIVEVEPGQIVKSEQPRVVFLGRLDPIKRPWVFTEMGRHFPHVEFLFLGKNHFQGEGSWQPNGLPGNVRLLGHVDSAEKIRLLCSAWTLVNTSIHEALPISFLEALACETPILSCQNPEDVTSRFGIYVGRWDGTGLEGLPQFVEGLRRLLDDEPFRRRLGQEGRRWVQTHHSGGHFVEAFREMCRRAGVQQ